MNDMRIPPGLLTGVPARDTGRNESSATPGFDRVMDNARQRRASLRLTAWLSATHDIASGDVIGHSENRSSRFHTERYGPWRCQTHGDFSRPTMQEYRRLLNQRLAGTTVDRSAPDWVRSGC